MRSTLSALSLLTGLLSIASATPTCRNVTILVSISVTNVQLPSVLDFNHLETLLSLSLSQLVNLPIAGTYKIFGSYCEPEVTVASRKNTLQLVVPSVLLLLARTLILVLLLMIIPANTGHETLYHYTQKDMLANAFNWLAWMSWRFS